MHTNTTVSGPRLSWRVVGFYQRY